jgi:hypothetical protein
MGSHAAGVPQRTGGTAVRSAPSPELVDRLLSLALRGIAKSYQPATHDVVFTRRCVGVEHLRVVPEGSSLRYTAMVALGMHRLPESDQRAALAGLSARELAAGLVDRCASGADLGDIAVVCWAAAETGAANAPDSLDRLLAALTDEVPLPTVHAAWALTALVAARRLGATKAAADRLRDRLIASRRTDRALFGHATEGGRFVGCFADQVYPIQALARFAQVYGDATALDAANACADQICELQGADGQWWWHYDSRTDRVLEGYPVYSVHQHAMAPMALHDLRAAGGHDHAESIELGLSWLESTPERAVTLIDDEHAAVWRKIARREFPRKSVRAAKASVRRVLPGAEFSLLDRATPPLAVDWECRPYELGWLLYAWTGREGVPDGDLAR